jgi:ribulose-phosphate 3-epimerase
MTKIVAPSLLSANFANLQEDINMINQSEAQWIHIDVMDGVFVPNITIGPVVINSIKKHTSKILDVHLMIIEPDRYIENFKLAGADIISVHYEACKHLNRTINSIKNLGLKAGVVLNPHTNVNLLEDIISEVDLVLLMSVNPGFGGQKFIENTFKKISSLINLIEKTNSKALIEIDGGVDTTNAKKLFETGADVLVAGNSVFTSENPISTIYTLLNS